jgi:hypothetical protein
MHVHIIYRLCYKYATRANNRLNSQQVLNIIKRKREIRSQVFNWPITFIRNGNYEVGQLGKLNIALTFDREAQWSTG